MPGGCLLGGVGQGGAGGGQMRLGIPMGRDRTIEGGCQPAHRTPTVSASCVVRGTLSEAQIGTTVPGGRGTILTVRPLDRWTSTAQCVQRRVGGGAAISHLTVLRNQPALFGSVTSNPTAWRL
ncbi:hypothetical protein GCM10027290_16650 [Micromonospora sonneratiae]